jgi:hypothetical protein
MSYEIELVFIFNFNRKRESCQGLGNSWYFNPGSVSVAYKWDLSDPAQWRMWVDRWADYAIVTSEGASLGIIFRHVPFDVNELVRIIRASGRPYAEEAISVYQL